MPLHEVYGPVVPHKRDKPPLMPRSERREFCKLLLIPFIPIPTYYGASDRRWFHMEVK